MEQSRTAQDATEETIVEHLEHILQSARNIAEIDLGQRMFEAYNATSAIVTNLLPLLDGSAPEVANKVRVCLAEIQVAVHGKEAADELKIIWDKE